MGRRVITIYDKDKPEDGKTAKKDVEKARVYYAHKQLFSDYYTDAELALLVLCLCKSTKVIDEHCSSTVLLETLQIEDGRSQSPTASQPEAASTVVPKRASTYSTAWFLQGNDCPDRRFMSELLKTDKIAEVAELVKSNDAGNPDDELALKLSFSATGSAVTANADFKLGDDDKVIWDDGAFFGGHWMPKSVESAVEKDFKDHKRQFSNVISTEHPQPWTPTRLQITDTLCWVSSEPNYADFMRKAHVLSDANVCMYPFEDEVSGHFIVKLQLLKDVNKGDELVWFVPAPDFKDGRVRMMMLDDEQLQERRMCLLGAKFRRDHGKKLTKLREDAMKKLNQEAVEGTLVEPEIGRHLRNMRDVMQEGNKSNKLAATTLKSTSRLRFRKQTEKERKDEGDLSPGEVELMDDPKWIPGATAVIGAVKEWCQTTLGGEYALLVDGLYGPHGLIASSPTWPALPGRPHFDSVFPFFSGHDLAIILRSMFRYLLHPCMYLFVVRSRCSAQ